MRIKPFKLERYYSQYEFKAKYSLCNSDCESMMLKDLLAMEDGADDAFQNLWLGYTTTEGHPKLRQGISNTYANTTADNIMVCSGAQEPIFLFAQAMLDKGDEVIVQSPCYQSVESIPESIGCVVKNWKVSFDDDRTSYKIDDLSNLITDKTKVIFLNSPHNPTAYHFTKSEQDSIIEMARSKGIIILCDEVYRELEYDSQNAIPAICDAYELGVSIGVMSKAYGLPGLRIGWIATKEQDILEKFAILKEYTTICNSAPSEFLAELALRNRHSILQRNLTIIKSNLALYNNFFKKYEHLFSWSPPIAGPIAFVKMKFDKNDMEFAQRLLKEKSLLILPGEVYDYKGFFRIGLGRKEIPKALEVFEEYIVDHLVVA